MKGNLHISITPFQHESRVLRETAAIVEHGLAPRVYIAALLKPGLLEHEEIDDHRAVWRVPIMSLPDFSLFKLVKFAEYAIKVLLYYRDKVDVVNCHAISSLPIACIFKLLFGAKVIYDTHELETESTNLRGLRKTFSKILERVLIPYTDAVIVVCDSIGEWYKDNYSNIKVETVRSIPDFVDYENYLESEPNKFRQRFSIPDDELIFIYQGAFFEGRGIDILLKAFANIGKERHIIFMGFGPLEDRIKDYSGKYANIHLHPPVKSHEVLSYSKYADVGISLFENTCLSYYYSLPNKLFEYILSGIPIIVSDFPEMGKLVDQNDCGWKVAVQETAVAELISNLSISEISAKKIKARNSRKNISWETEKNKLVQIYREFNQALSGIG